MKNKFLMTAALLSVFGASSAIAGTPAALSPVTNTTPFVASGPYVGLDLGVGSLAPADSSEDNLALTYDAFTGYDYVVNNWLAGVELGAGNKNTQNYTLSADLKAGRVMDRITTAYVKFGYGLTDLTKNGMYIFDANKIDQLLEEHKKDPTFLNGSNGS